MERQTQHLWLHRVAAFLHRRWIDGFLCLTLMIGLASVVNLAQDIGRPFGGFVTVREPGSEAWYVFGATPSWWPGIARDHLTDQDELVALDGQPYGPNYLALYAAAYTRGQQSVTLTLERNGVRRDVQTPLVLFTAAMAIEARLPDAICALCMSLLAIALYRARPADELNRATAISFALVASILWAWSTYLSHDEIRWLARLLDLIWVIEAPFIGPTLFLAIMLFPFGNVSGRAAHRFDTVRLAWLVLMLVASACTVTYIGLKVVWWSMDWSPLAANLEIWLFRVHIVLTFGDGLFVVLRVGWLFLRHRGSSRIRRQTATILAGFLIASPILVLQFWSATGQGGFFFLQGLDLRYLYVSIPLAFAFVILRYQTFHSVHPLFVTVFILTGSALIASVGDWFARSTLPMLYSDNATGQLNLGSASYFVPMFAIAVTTGTISIFMPRLLTRLLRWDAASYGAVRTFSSRVLHQTSMSRLPHTITSTLVAELKLEHASIWLPEGDTNQADSSMFRLSAQTGKQIPECQQSIRLPSPPGAYLFEQPARLSQENAAGYEPFLFLRQYHVEAIAPLIVQGQWFGILALGKRWDEELFHERDLEIIELIAQQCALFLTTSQQIEELRRVPARVTEAQERERFKIAQELHDTIQLFLGRLPFHLEVSRSLMRSDPAAADARLQRCIGDVEDAARTTRQIRSNLAPVQLKKGLAQPLDDLLVRFRARSGLAVSADIAADLDAHLSVEARHVVYRVVQQALDNVESHAQASAVHVSISLTTAAPELRVTIVVEDDGCGFTPEQQSHAEAQGHFGLISMLTRVEALGGELQITSSPGRGTRVSGWVPV